MIVAVTAALGSALLAGAGAAAAGTRAPASGHAASSAGSWGTAEEVPGTATLNAGQSAGVDAVSCASAGNCGAVGHYTNKSHHQQAFVVNESDGTWGTAEKLPGTFELNKGGHAAFYSVSCPAVGDCSAGGFYTDSSGHEQAFVINETNGRWNTAEEVPGTAALNAGGDAAVDSVSCGAAGDCGAGGFYTDSSGDKQAFVISTSDGVWGSAEEVPGAGALNAGGYAGIRSVSCNSGGNCSAGGYYASGRVDRIPTIQAFVVSETSGTWGTAEEVPGSGALNTGGSAQIYSVSCASAGNCSAGGEYTNRSPATQAFVVSETNGTWASAERVPGITVLNQGLFAQVSSVSCASVGNCSAGGFYQDASFNTQAFVVNETNGVWAKAEEVPGTAALNAGGSAMVVSVSCPSVGNCGVGGHYTDASDNAQAFVVDETAGIWGTAEEVPGSAALNAAGQAGVNSVSCTAAGVCTAGGGYASSVLTDGKLALQALVDDETTSG